MISRLHFVILLSLAGFTEIVIASDNLCQIDLDNEVLETQNGKAKYPLIVDKNGDIIYPVGRTLNFTSDNSVTADKLPQLGLYCHKYNGKSLVSSSSIEPLKKSVQYVPLKCNDEGKFVMFDETSTDEVDIYAAKCTQKQYPTLKKDENEATLCSDKGADGRTTDLEDSIHLVHIGWNMSAMNDDTEIKDMIQLCIDEKTYGTLWTKHIVRGASIKFQDKGGKRPSFRNDNPRKKRFFNGGASSRLTTMYSKKEQKKMEEYNELEGIIDSGRSGTNFLAKGHLSPDAAFVYQLEQYATYYYINVAPQFQSFNAGNWKALEWATREVAESLNRNILTYTGTNDILSYENKSLYLWFKLYKEINQGIPVPKHYWKIIYDEQEHQGVAFLGLNDPYSEDLGEADYLCPNECEDIKWFDKYVPKEDVETKGHITCCTIKNLALVVSNVGNFISGDGKKLTDATLLTDL